jgi:hypothetical protein
LLLDLSDDIEPGKDVPERRAALPVVESQSAEVERRLIVKQYEEV